MLDNPPEMESLDDIVADIVRSSFLFVLLVLSSKFSRDYHVVTVLSAVLPSISFLVSGSGTSVY